MAFQPLKLSTFERPSGKRESRPAIAISEGGQIRFSTLLSKEQIGERKFLVVQWDVDSRTMQFKAVDSVPKGFTETDLIPVARAKDAEQVYFGGNFILRHEAIGYDYKASGNQTYAVELTEPGKDGRSWMSIILPEKATPRPKTPRKAKDEKKAPATPATPSQADDDII